MLRVCGVATRRWEVALLLLQALWFTPPVRRSKGSCIVHRVTTTTARWFALTTLVLALTPAIASAAVVTAPVKAVSFANGSTGYIAGGIPGTRTDNTAGFVSYSKDGGATWHAEYLPTRYMVAAQASLDGASCMAFQKDFDGVFTGLSSGAFGAWTTPILNRTVDLVDAENLSGGRRVAVGKLSAINPIALIASSVNGAAWTKDQQGPPMEDAEGYDITRNELSSVDAATGGTVAWAVGNDYSGLENSPTFRSLVYKTDNSGASWTQQVSPLTSGLNCVAAVDAQTAFIGQESRFVLRTLDGSTWAAMPAIPNAAFKARAIDAVDKDTVLVVGDGGQIAWTANASAPVPTWTMKTSGTSNALLGAQAIDLAHWIVVGDNETILRTADGGVTWTGNKALTPPTTAITSPPGPQLLNSPSISIQGTSSDGAGTGVASVEVRVKRANGQSWNGSAWVDPETWLPASQGATADGWDAWEKDLSIPDVASVGSLAVLARAIDGFGLKSTTYAWISSDGSNPVTLTATKIVPTKTTQTIGYGGTAVLSGKLTAAGSPLFGATVTVSGGTAQTDVNGNFSILVKPTVKTTYTLRFEGDATHSPSTAQVVVIPHAKVTTPVVPRYVKHTKSFRAYTYLYPKHTAGKTAMTFYFQKRNSKGKYSTVKTVTAKAVTSSSARSKLTSPLVKLKAGKYRVMARHSDAGHASTDSARKYFTVR
jgi:photosystem II stability/assembly factor-like uncharacterized protein